MEELTEDVLSQIALLPSRFSGRRFILRAQFVGQALGDEDIVLWNDDLVTAAGCTPGDTLRFQIAGPMEDLHATGQVRLYRVHTDGGLARTILDAVTVKLGFQHAKSLAGRKWIVECRGNYHEPVMEFVDTPGQRKWALIWRLVSIEQRRTNRCT